MTELLLLADIPDSLTGWFLTGIAGIVVALWAKNNSSDKKFHARTDGLEAKYDASIERSLETANEVGELKGRIAFAEEVHPKLDSIQISLVEIKDILPKEKKKG
tara:strand:- start:17509 stop:17820 length:312 start_codon:yes stop_codon:yes gene_type:complete